MKDPSSKIGHPFKISVNILKIKSSRNKRVFKCNMTERTHDVFIVLTLYRQDGYLRAVLAIFAYTFTILLCSLFLFVDKSEPCHLMKENARND